MEEQQRYYWLKLKEDFFEEDTIRFLRDQPNGDEYCVFYLILCCKSLKANGKVARVVGDTIIPYDLKALARLTGVSEDTAKCALALLLQYGIIRQLDTGELFVQQVLEMTGSESASKAAIKKRNYRLKKALEDKKVDKVGTNCPTEYRVKSIELDIDKEIYKEKTPKSPSKFRKPAIEEIKAYCQEKGYRIDAEYFFDYYESVNWKRGNTPIKSWKHTLATWNKNQIGWDKDKEKNSAKKESQKNGLDFS